MKTLLIKFPSLLKFLPSSVKANQEFMVSIIQKNAQCFKYASNTLKDNETFILSFFVDGAHRYFNHSYSPKEMKQLKKKKHELFLKYCSESLKNNSNFMLELITRYEYELNYEFVQFLPSSYLDDLSFWIQYIEKNGFLSFYQLAIEKSSTLKHVYITTQIESRTLSFSLEQIYDIDLLKEYLGKMKEGYV